jgi:hypothetical protein
MDKIIYIEDIPVIELGEETYSPSDVTLISTLEEQSTFNSQTDYIEYFIYDGNKNLFISENKLDTFNIYDNNLLINPEGDLEERIQDQGKYYTVYNFLKPLLSSSIQETYYVAEISTDRTEVRLSTTDILSQDVIEGVGALKQEIDTATFYRDFYLNFGSNQLIIGNNVLLDTSIPDQPTVLIKLYEPLPDNITTNRQCWTVDKIAESRAYLLNVSISFEDESEFIEIQGPNFSILTTGQTNSSNQPVDSTILLQTPSSSLFYELNNKLNNPGVALNVDYSDFTKFVFFSTVRTRVENFYYKLALLEEYTYSSSISTDITSYYNSGSYGHWENKINETITGFDGFERYLYFESSSTAWPKSNSIPPYINVSTTSSQGQTWLTDTLILADTYDNGNKDRLVLTIPEFIKNDVSNINYELFVDMVAQVYDEIWLYLTDVTQKYSTVNGVNEGLSKDLVGQALKDVGLKLYENNYTSDDLYSTYLGITPLGSLLPNTGQELVETYITASATGSLIPINNLPSETYKRLYHNLPLLLKKKGTVAGLRTLINAFGIPDTILRINEFGGKDKNPNTWDYCQNEYDYAFSTSGNGFITSSFILNSDWGAANNVPGAIEFRFKAESVPPTNVSQSLWYTNRGVGVFLEYTGSGLATGSYSGSIVDPYYQYGTLKFISGTDSSSVYLPFFDGGWWSVLVNSGSNGYELYAKNSIYSGNDSNTIGFQASSTLNISTLWSSSSEIYFANSSATHVGFSGSLQEIRYYTQPLSENSFNDYVMNPSSIEQSQYLAFRASLGGELYTGSTSIHPSVTGSYITSSFSSNSTFYYNGTYSFIPNTEVNLYDQPAVGIKNAVSNKVKLQDSTLYGTTLSNISSLEQNYPASSSFTTDINYLEVGYSPQNEINEDIMDTFGYFNIGEYIGDPRQISTSTYTYPPLDGVNREYFKKYTNSYSYQDYFRLIKFYDNSLFKLIKDFIPARTAAATGAIVKQHLLERNRQRPAQLTWTRPEYTASAVSVARDYETGSIGVFDGGPAGAVNGWINISQSYTASILGPAGPVTYIESSEREFYNGVYSGSRIDVINNKLQDNPLLGAAYRISIPNQQNLDVGRSINYSGISASLGSPITGTLPLDLEAKEIDAYNNTTYEYSPAYTVQSDIEIFITGGFVNTTATEDSQLTIYLKENGKVIATGFDDNGNNDDLNLTITVSNLSIKAGSTYKLDFLYTEGDNASPSTARIDTGSYWKATVDNLAAQSTYYLDPTVYTQQNLPGNINEFADYNSLLNNVYSNRVSTKYFDVDYSNDALNPTNFQSIISESAIYAQVQDSNYDASTIFYKNRFAGIKNTGQVNTSINFSTSSITPGYPIDQFSEYIAYFDWIGGSDPQYPGGGNVHLTTLIKTDGTVIGLDSSNKNLEIIEKLFKAGTIPSMYLQTFSVIEPVQTTTIIEGGALYQTIAVSSGSFPGNFAGNYTDGNSYVYQLTFISSSNTVLQETGSVVGVDTIYALMNQQVPGRGSAVTLQAGVGDDFIIFNNRTGTLVRDSNTVPYEDTLLPLRYGDYMRFGNTGSYSYINTSSLDGTFTGAGLYQIKSIFTGSFGTDTGSIEISPALSGRAAQLVTDTNSLNQYCRIFRRVPDETFILIKEKPINPGSGIIVPYNFNPSVDPIALAKQAGLI